MYKSGKMGSLSHANFLLLDTNQILSPKYNFSSIINIDA